MDDLQVQAEQIQLDLRLSAIAARARGDSEEERRVLDRLIAFEERAGLS